MIGSGSNPTFHVEVHVQHLYSRAITSSGEVSQSAWDMMCFHHLARLFGPVSVLPNFDRKMHKVQNLSKEF